MFPDMKFMNLSLSLAIVLMEMSSKNFIFIFIRVLSSPINLVLNFRQLQEESDLIYFLFLVFNFQLCRPLMIDGTDCSNPRNADRYIEKFTCSNPHMTDEMLREARMSFPSAHSNFSFYTMLFCCVSQAQPLSVSQMKLV